MRDMLRQALPLARMVLIVTLAAAIIELLLALPVIALFAGGMAAEGLVGEFLSVLGDGLVEGLSLSLPMALATVLFFRDSRRLKRYGLAMLAIALIVSILRWGWIMPLAQFAMAEANALAALAVGRRFIGIALNLVVCRIAAGRYRRRALKS